MYLYPDLDTFVILPWRPQRGKVARLLCDVCKEDGSTLEMSPRTILKRVVQETAEKGYTFHIDPECEFFLFHTDENGVPTTVTHERAGYMDVGPMDLGENARRDIVLNLEEMGFKIESSHHETAPGQQEIDFKEAEPLEIADSLVTFKSAVRSIARRFGLHATFMPKPKQGVAGSGMHTNISVYQNGKNIFCEENEMRWFIGGIMAHAKGICAISNPLVNSYKRILDGQGAPKELVWTKRNYNALIKVSNRPGEDIRVELRFPDPSANPYLLLALCIAAGIEGIEKQTEPGAEVTSISGSHSAVDSLPENLREAVCCMREDAFVEQVLGKEFTNIYTEAKMQEWNDYMTQVSDWEIDRYLNCI